jgi:hypothetical protein
MVDMVSSVKKSPETLANSQNPTLVTQEFPGLCLQTVGQ